MVFTKKSWNRLAKISLLYVIVCFMVIDIPVAAVSDTGVENEAQFYDPNACGPDGAGTPTSGEPSSAENGPLVGDTDAEKVFNFLKTDFGDNGAAGLVGNFMWEVGGGSEDLPTDSGTSHKGIAQWSSGRYANLVKFARDSGGEPTDLATQAGFVKFELTEGGYESTGAKLPETSTPKEASDIVFSEYERPGDSTAPRRAQAAQKIFDKYAGGTSSSTDATTPETNQVSTCACSASPSELITSSAEPTDSLEAYVKRYATAFLEVSKKAGVPYDAVIAQTALESGNGASELVAKYNNFGGIKAQAGKPSTPPLPTIEGSGTRVMARFRAFSSPEEGITEQAKFYTENSRYAEALKYPRNPVRFIQELKKANYATDPNYVSKVLAVLTSVEDILTEMGLPLSKDVTPERTPEGGDRSSEPVTSTNDCANNSSSGEAYIDGDYAFPVAIKKNDVTSNNPFPCTPSTCHHDGTPAFDLSKKSRDDTSAGIPVFAIESGTISSYKPEYDPPAPLGGPIPGCPSYQLTGESGWVYWYGHTQTTSLREGTKVTKGQQIAEIGLRKCTGNGSYPHLHIDRGSPKGRSGGSIRARDAGLVEIMNKLYEGLP